MIQVYGVVGWEVVEGAEERSKAAGRIGEGKSAV